jgi:hypothetical protein
MGMNTKNLNKHATRSRAAAIAVALGLTLGAWQSTVHAQVTRDQAKRLHDRITGVPPTADVLDAMVARGAPLLAAELATEQSAFYNVTLKNFAAPWTNRDQSVFVPLNDYTATVIGMVRDDVPFNTLLSHDYLYVGTSRTGAPGYSPSDNNHYEYLDDNNVDLSDPLNLAQVSQSTLTNGEISSAAAAGIMTSRAAAKAFFVLGTNRAMFRFTMLNHLCHDLEQLHDTSRAPDRVRQDVSRSPGGDSRLFLNNCVGCHSGMDPLAQAFARYNYAIADEDAGTGQIQFISDTDPIPNPAWPHRVHPKYLINADNFLPGFKTQDDSWENRWREGPNQLLGWSSSLPGSGQGAQSLGRELANSDAFAQCQVEKVFRRVCFRSPSDSLDRQAVSDIVGIFKTTYNLKQVFQRTGVYCMGN